MTRRRAHRKAESVRPKRLGPVRLVLEPLEARRLLAGINVTVYVDVDGSRNFDAVSDLPAANRLIYVDLDRNGHRGASEPIAVTDNQGTATFEGLPVGDYFVGLLTNSAQQQVEPVVASAPRALVSFSEALTGEPFRAQALQFFATEDLSTVWAVDSWGTARLISGPSDLPPEVQLGSRFGPLLSSAEQVGNQLVAVSNGVDGPELLSFDLRTGSVSHSSIRGELSQQQILGLTTAGDQVAVLTVSPRENPGENWLSLISGLPGEPILAGGVSIPAFAVAGVPGSSGLVALSSFDNERSVVTLHDSTDDFAPRSSLVFDGIGESVSISGDGRLAYVTLQGGGLVAVDLSAQQLRLAAILGEATGPIATNSIDGRIVTGSVRNSRELITWDTRQWLALSRSMLPSETQPSPVAAIAMDRLGDQVVAFRDSGVHEISLNVPANTRVRLRGTGEMASVRIGVRELETNLAPTAAEMSVREVDEDASDRIDLRTQVTDPNGDVLWFSLGRAPENGQLQLSHDGLAIYRPAENFVGLDSAIVIVHDGALTVELELKWEVQPVDDHPESISVSAERLPENALPGTNFGQVVISDVDEVADYHIRTTDSRFAVVDGRLIFVGGRLDFESQPRIEFDIWATDASDQSITIGTRVAVEVFDVNEPPLGITLSHNSVNERQSTANIGRLHVLDPDRSSDYEYYVVDTRFEIFGSQLRLAAGWRPNFADTPTIDVTVKATDGTFEIFGFFVIYVLENTQLPSEISLDGSSVIEKTPGATVGNVSVRNSSSQSHQFFVSDPRFSIVEGVLQLNEAEQMVKVTEPSVSLTISAQGSDGEQISREFSIRVVARPSPHHNSNNPADVNGDGVVSPIDVLIVINELNHNGSHPVSTGVFGNGEGPAGMMDVNGDGIISAIDVLEIINHLNGMNDAIHEELQAQEREPLQAEGEGGIETKNWPWASDDISDRERKSLHRIDAELELLLEQLSRQRAEK